MDTNVSNALAEYIQNGMTIGLIGVGKVGLELREYLAARYELTFLLCDPPRFADDSEDLCDALREVWGNGMGGCDFSTIRTETFLPLEYVVKKSDILLIQVPSTVETENMITGALLSNAGNPALRILNFSDPGVLAADVPQTMIC